jgi:hypothetical protein
VPYPSNLTVFQPNAVSRKSSGEIVTSPKTQSTKFIGNLLSIQDSLVRPEFSPKVRRERQTVACFVPDVAPFDLDGVRHNEFRLADHIITWLQTRAEAVEKAGTRARLTEDEKMLVANRLILCFVCSGMNINRNDTTDADGIHENEKGELSQTLNVNISRDGGISLELREIQPVTCANPMLAKMIKANLPKN